MPTSLKIQNSITCSENFYDIFIIVIGVAWIAIQYFKDPLEWYYNQIGEDSEYETDTD